MATLDLVVFVRIDRAHDPAGQVEDAAYRAEVDEWLGEIVDADCYDLRGDVDLLSLEGPWDRRANTVFAYIKDRGIR